MSQFGMHSMHAYTHVATATRMLPQAKCPLDPRSPHRPHMVKMRPPYLPRVGGWEHKIVVSGFDHKGCT